MVRPVMAPEPGEEQAHHRSLVLAGGGMRVAYQAGVLAALEEEGLRFHHIDGASGGTMNLSMLLTGQSIAEMCNRWRALDPRGFSAPLPLADYIRSPHWPALGGGRGVREKVFPALGIEAEEIRKAEGLVGTYNVCNFATKTAEVVHHTDVDEDLLVAAISLPVLMPAVHWRGAPYTDAVWIRDSNVPEAVRRGSDEVWLVWCIGNTPQYLNGSFRQYVHMIEMAANGSLIGDLNGLTGQPVASALRLHVVKPSRPLPLDPDYFLGRIDAAGLIGLGYRDACAYLRRPRPLSAPWGPEVTAMLPPEAGVAGRLMAAGTFAWNGCDGVGDAGPARIHLRLEAPAPAPGATQMVADAVGDIDLPGWRGRRPVERGTVTFEAGTGLSMDLILRDGQGRSRLRGRSVAGGLRVDLIEDDDPPEGRGVGSGRLAFGRQEAASVAAGLHAVAAASALDGWHARATATRIVWRAKEG